MPHIKEGNDYVFKNAFKVLRNGKDCRCSGFLLELIDSTADGVCSIAAGQCWYYHVSPLPLGIRSCCLHIYCAFVYSHTDCIFSSKLAHMSLFLVWVVDCAVAVSS